MTERRRLFFALWPDEHIRAEIHHWLTHNGIRGGLPHCPDNLHITLCFLGTVDADQQLVLEAGADALETPPAFHFELDLSGYWPKPRVLWLGCSQPPMKLDELAQQLRAVMAASGLVPESRPFVPHLTVLRKLSPPVVLPPVSQPIPWHAREFVLAWSQSTNEGVRYRVLRRWALGEESWGASPMPLR